MESSESNFISPTDQFTRSALMLASIAVVVAALYLAKSVLVPITLSVLLSFLLSPVCDWLERHGVGRIPAVLLTAFVGFAVLGVATWTAVIQITEMAPKLPEYEKNLKIKLSTANARVSAALRKVSRTADEFSDATEQETAPQGVQGSNEWPYAVRMVSSPASPLQVFGGLFGTLLEVLGSAGVVVVLVVFFLIRRDDLRDRFIRLVGRGSVTLTTQMLEDAGIRVSRYLSMQLLINVIFGTAVGIGLSLIGVPNSILWGILATTLRFIPYVGPWIAAAMPISLSMAISTDWMAPGLSVALFLVLELFTNNVLEPWLYGKNTGVSAVAVLLAAVFWTWLWGFVGLLLATPLTVCLLVIGKHIPQLAFLDTLLGNEPVFEPRKRIYQRLLAGDREEASELLDEFLLKSPLVDVYDSVLIPALSSAETHWHRGEMNEDRHAFMLRSLQEMIQEQAERQQELPEQLAQDEPVPSDANLRVADISKQRQLRILCLPAHNQADEIAGMMLAQVVADGDCAFEVASSADVRTTIQLMDFVENHQADVICISAAPPAAVAHARYVSMRLRRRLPDVPLIVGLWNAQVDLAEAKERIGSADRVHIVASLADAQKQIRIFIRNRPPAAGKSMPTETAVPAVSGD